MMAQKSKDEPLEVNATIDDFFSDEKDSSSNDSDEEDSMDDVPSPRQGKSPRGSSSRTKKKKKKKSQIPGQCLPNPDFTPAEFRKRGKELIDFIANYMEGTRDRAASVNVSPGFLFRSMPKTAPKDGCKFEDFIKDINENIVPGIPQWQNPGHHAMMPLGASYISLLGSLLADGLGCASLTWNECPSSVELEMIVMNWLAELTDLPLDFHFFGKSRNIERHVVKPSHHPSASGPPSGVNRRKSSVMGAPTRRASSISGVGNQSLAPGGGGIILASTMECLVTAMIAARRIVLDDLTKHDIKAKESELLETMVAYCSEQAHPGMERVCEIVGCTLKRVWTDREGIMHCNTLKSVLDKDIAKGYIPFFIMGTAGTIASASVDQLDQIGPFISKNYPKVWFHIDASYAGSAFICREYQPLLHGVNYADSINMTFHKWLPIHMECACLWVRRISNLTSTYNREDPTGPLTIPTDEKNAMADYRNWGIPMMRRFKAIKLYTVFKLYGAKKLQQKIREDVRRAKELEAVMHEDHRFEILTLTKFGIVTFRCKRPDSNDINKQILDQINRSLIIKMTGVRVGNKYWLRFVVAGRYTRTEDVLYSWEMIKRATSEVCDNPVH